MLKNSLRLSVVAGALAVSLGAEAVNAQDNWSGELWIESEPSFKRSRTVDTEKDTVDAAEFTLAAKLSTPEIADIGKVNFILGSAYSPVRFDGEDRESALFAQVSFGTSYLSSRAFRGFSPEDISAYGDGTKLSGHVRHTESFTGLLSDNSGNSQVAQLGIEYRNNLIIFCEANGTNVKAQSDRPCDNKPKTGAFGFVIGGNIARNWSTDPTKENDSISAAGTLLFPEIRKTFLPKIDLTVDHDRYRQPSSAGLLDRRDWTVEAIGSADLEPLFPEDFPVSMEIGVAQSWQDSNDPTKDKNETKAFVSLKYVFGSF